MNQPSSEEGCGSWIRIRLAHQKNWLSMPKDGVVCLANVARPGTFNHTGSNLVYTHKHGKSGYKFSALNITQSRLFCGRKSARRRRLWEDGRIRAERARLSRSPSTVPIRTKELVIADLRIFRWWWLERYDDV